MTIRYRLGSHKFISDDLTMLEKTGKHQAVLNFDMFSIES